MKLSLPANICRLRKAHAMTQEQLAEALGVTFAAVSKWERGIATPDLKLLAEMADLFGVSFDALVGFEVKNGSAEALAERMLGLQREKQYEQAVLEAEKALLRYPNDFRIVCQCGELYGIAGIERNHQRYLRRSIELLEHAVLLLSQNTDPHISETTIRYLISQCYLALGDVMTSIDILKKYNVSGVHNAFIALACATHDNIAPKEAEPYLQGACGSIVTTSVHTMLAYANYYTRLGQYASARDALLWLMDMLTGLKQEIDAVAYVDKVIALCWAECAHLCLLMGEEEGLEPNLQKAFRLAKAFDNAPTYCASNLKFCVGDTKTTTMYDGLGETAVGSIEKLLTQQGYDRQLLALWQQIAAMEERQA